MPKKGVNSQENTIEGVPNHYHSPYPKIHVTGAGFFVFEAWLQGLTYSFVGGMLQLDPSSWPSRKATDSRLSSLTNGQENGPGLTPTNWQLGFLYRCFEFVRSPQVLLYQATIANVMRRVENDCI
jgi:hypothetical protein